MEWTEPDTTCAGCGRPLPGPEVTIVHIRGKLGEVAERVHADDACAELARAAHPEQPARLVSRTKTKEERMAEKVKRP